MLSPSAAAEILASQTEQEEKCDLEIEYELDKAGTECELQKELIEIRVQTCEEARDIENTQKDLQIEELQKQLRSSLGSISGYGLLVGQLSEVQPSTPFSKRQFNEQRSRLYC